MELKNILAKQSGPEVAEKLATYQQNLKERTKQLREMASELKSYQSQVNAYKFEIERLDGAIGDVKKQYYDRKRREQRNMPSTGQIIEEEDEGGLDNDQDDGPRYEDTNMIRDYRQAQDNYSDHKGHYGQPHYQQPDQQDMDEEEQMAEEPEDNPGQDIEMDDPDDQPQHYQDGDMEEAPDAEAEQENLDEEGKEDDQNDGPGEDDVEG